MNNILEFFIKEPEREFHVRQISKMTGKSPTTISKHLKELSKKNILKSRKKLNHLLFKGYIENPKFKQLKLNYNLNLLQDSKIISYLVKEFNHPEAIILFGSFSKAEDISSSDIDLLIITPLKKDLNLEKFEKKLGHKIQIFTHSNKDIKNIMKRNKELLNSWINGITIEGFFEVFK